MNQRKFISYDIAERTFIFRTSILYKKQTSKTIVAEGYGKTTTWMKAFNIKQQQTQQLQHRFHVI